MAGDQHQADGRPGREGDDHRLDHGSAQIDAENPGQLDIAEPHAVRPDHRGGEQEARRTGSRGDPRGQLTGCGKHAISQGQQQAEDERPVGHQPGAQVADRDNAEQGYERSVEQRGGHIVESPMVAHLSP